MCDEMIGVVPADPMCMIEFEELQFCENQGEESVCGPGQELLGQFATWCGKVNVHTDPWTGEWLPDDGCKAGCNIKDLSYCQKYYPGAEEVVEIAVSPEEKPFFTAGCMIEYPKPGQHQFACCGTLMEP